MAGTRWIRLDVDYFANPKTLAAGRDARDVHLASICWVGRYLTDGHIPPEAVEAIIRDAGVIPRSRAAAVERVVQAQLWIPNGSGFDLHDYVEMNGSRADVERERDMFRARQQRYRDRRKETPK